jgi:ABC-type phosphate transport system substrate-binding protein
MHRSLRAGRRWVRAALVLGTVAIAPALVAPAAHASFTLAACHGTPTAGRGASFPQLLHNAGFWGAGFDSSAGCGGTAGAPSHPTYNIATPDTAGAKVSGSGAGLGACGAGQSGFAVGHRDAAVRFCASDDPPTPAQLANMDAGDPSTTADDGLIHQLPWGGGALIVVVHVPEGCALPAPGASNTDTANGTAMTGNTADVGVAGTGDTVADRTTRPLISAQKIEAAFAGDPSVRTWAQLIPGLTGTAGNAGSGDNRWNGRDCSSTNSAAGVPITRIVRSDSSGTTFNFKSYLSLVRNGTKQIFWMGNTSLFGSAQGGNATWPGWTGNNVQTDAAAHAADATTFVCGDATDFVCGGYKSGNDGIARSVEATDGAIGYSDIADARLVTLSGVAKPQQDFEDTKTSSGARDYTFWLPMQNNPDAAAGQTFIEPTKDKTNHLNSGAGTLGSAGSNCANLPALRNVPTAAASPKGDPTLGDWSTAIATGGSGYPICVLTYGLIWDDNSTVYGNTPTEEGYARTVKDYVSFIASPFGQSLIGTDFSPTPATLQTILQNGVNAIDWNKSAGGGVNPTPTATPTPVPTTTPVITPPATKPSNVFTLAGVKAQKTSAVLSLTLPAAGKVAVVSSLKVSKKKTVRFATVTQQVQGGTGKVTLRPSSAALAALRKVSTKSSLVVNIEVTFTPTGGSPASKTVTLKIKGTKKPKKKK